MNHMNTDKLKEDGVTYVFRTQSGELWGVKLIDGKPVLHRLPQSQERQR